MYKVVDLFAGAGGLSLGFMQTKKYDIKVAFENNPAMQKTYKKNHMGVDVRDDVCLADYNDIQKKYGNWRASVSRIFKCKSAEEPCDKPK